MRYAMTSVARGLAALAISAFVAGGVVTLSTQAHATPAIAQQSGKGCTTCHASASGGKLKKAGEDWKAGKR